MTIIPIFKKCPVCGKKYVWNPDIGKTICPHCHGLGKVKSQQINNMSYRECDCYENIEFRLV